MAHDGRVTGAFASGGLLHRGRESSHIDAALEGCLAGSPAVLLVQGPRGSGKTSLLQAAIDRAPPSALVLGARCHESERDFQFGVVRQLFDPLIGGEVTLPAPAAGRGPIPDVLDGYYRAARSLATARPLLITIDDLSQADPQSVRWWRYIIRRLDGLPALAIATVDTDSAQATELVDDLDALSYARRLRPEPLCARCTAAFLAGRLRDPVPDVVADACHAISQGNPLVLHHLAEELDADPGGVAAADLNRIGAQVLAGTTLAWLRRSRPALTVLLENLVILGPDGDLETAAVLANRGETEAVEARATLRQTGVLAPAGGAPADRFTHEAVRAAVLARIDPVTRAESHVRAAGLLSRIGLPATRVAEHFMAIGPVNEQWVVAALRRAAREVVAAGDWEAASRYLRRAAAEAVDPDHEVAAELAAAELHRHVRPALQHLHATVQRVDDLPERAVLLRPVANPLVTLASADAGPVFATMAAALPGADPELWGPFAAQALIAGVRPGPLRVLAEAAAGPSGYELLATLAVVAAAGHSRERADRLARRCIAAGRLAGADVRWPATVSGLIALSLSWTERLDEAWYWSTHAMKVATDSRSVTGRAFALSVRVEVALRRGRLQQALAAGQEAMRLHQAAGMESLRAAVAARLVRILLERGEVDATEPLLVDAGGAAGEHLLTWVEYLHSRGLHATARNRPHEALRLHLACGEHLAARGVTGPSWLPWRDRAVLAHVRLGRLDPAWSLAREAIGVARAWGAPGRLGASLTAAASAAPEPAARIGLLREAVDVLNPTESALELAHAQIRLGAALLAAGERDGRAVLAGGAQLAAECGATAIAMRARQRLSGRPDRAGPDASALSPAERRVVDLVVRGMNNAEVAAALLVSKRTVDTHLGRIYRKLNIRSRTRLAEALSGPPVTQTRAGAAER